MKKVYTRPVVYPLNIDCEYRLLAGSVVLDNNKDNAKKYYCPYASSLYCEKYSEHMNNWRKSVEHYAKTGKNYTFYTKAGCIYEKTCDVYRLYIMANKQHENNGK